MDKRRWAVKQVLRVTIICILAALLLTSPSANAGRLPQGPTQVESLADPRLVLQYQGRLLDPNTGSPKPDGSYPMVISLYDAASGGSILWSETKSVTVDNGLFTIYLGDTVPLELSDFDGQPLWLSVTVGADPEATPRQRVTHVAYALHAEDADMVDGRQAADFAAASHRHSARDITSETLDPAFFSAYDDLSTEGRIGSGSAQVAAGSHGHNAADIASGTLATARFSAYDDLSSEGRIGSASGQVAAGGHSHDTRYYTESESNSRYVDVTGDTMSGTLNVPRVSYTAPRTQYFMVGSEGFFPADNVDYRNAWGNGGAYISSGLGRLVAPVHLPEGAVVTEFEVFFDDTSSSDMTVDLQLQGMTGGYAALATVSSTGVSGYGSRTDTSIHNATIRNRSYSYMVDAYSTSWSSALKIKGALVTYTISEAP
jgi:hypothetical protein